MNWPLVRLGDVCEFKYGKSLPASQRDGGDSPVYGSNGIVGYHSNSISVGPTIVIGRKGSFGEVSFSPVSCWPIDTTYYIDGTATSADLNWLRYRVDALGLTGLNRAAAVPGLNREDAYRQAFLLPPLDQQRNIASLLGTIDCLRISRRRLDALWPDLKNAIFTDTFTPSAGATVLPLGELIAEGPQNGLYKPASEYGAGTPIVRIDSFRSGSSIRLGELKRVQVSAPETALYGLRDGDVLINRVNSPEHLGKATVVSKLTEPTIFESNMMRLSVNTQRVVPEYVVAFLGTVTGKGQIRTASKDAVNQSSINQSDVRGFDIPLPPIDLQRTYLQRIALAAAMFERSRESLTALDELFASVRHRAFRGEL